MSSNFAQGSTAPDRLPRDQQEQEPAVTRTAKPKRKNRNRKRRNRRQSFVASEDSGPVTSELSRGLVRANMDQMQDHTPYYRGRNSSNTSLESESLLDHR